ncbi:ferredoxin reductase [Amycolatopsis sp. NPDC101161]|uniref:ferredoxin reductase n=1 Tax=Amycolatopsis sp. NPDC101161 TaxID=3363940 RepID=UPI0038201E12
MAGTTLRRRLDHRRRTARLVETRDETATARTLRFAVPGWPGHLAGQHVDLRLTADDGYTAQRSYSLSAPADGEFVEVTVQLVPGGEVSPYLVRDIEVGDVVEVLGPLGGWFVWRPEQPEPVVLIGGGSGVAPLMAMVRARSAADPPFRLLYSARTPADVYFAGELSGPGRVVLYTREAPGGVERAPHRIDAADLEAYGLPAADEPTCYVCGPTPFVEAVTGLLVDAGHDPGRVRAERFGASGG